MQGWKTGVNGTDLWGMLAASFAWIPTTVGLCTALCHAYRAGFA